MIEIVEPGPLATLQDLGRPGHLSVGVPRSGAFDRAALRLGNRLVGNPEGAAAIEVTFGGLVLRAVRAVTVAVTGAPCPGADHGVPLTLRAGALLRLGRPQHGLRSYLAVRGGIAVDPVLGSASTDTLSGLGPAALRAGDVLLPGPSPAHGVSGADVSRASAAGTVLAVRLGPRDDWFTSDARAALLSTTWRVRSECDRVGVRLDGFALARARPGELPSEAVLPGAVQVPPDGRPIVFGPDAPVTGGYPVIAVVADPDSAAQLRPGDEVRFSIAR